MEKENHPTASEEIKEAALAVAPKKQQQFIICGNTVALDYVSPAR